jgi:hypothetical protein
MCTLWALDRVVLVADWAGLPMFSGVPRVCRGWNAVRVPPRARITPRQRGFCFNVWTLSRRVPLTLSAVCAWRCGCLFGCVGGGVRVLAGGPSVCWNLGVWVVLSCCSAASCWPSLVHGQELW